MKTPRSSLFAALLVASGCAPDAPPQADLGDFEALIALLPQHAQPPRPADPKATAAVEAVAASFPAATPSWWPLPTIPAAIVIEGGGEVRREVPLARDAAWRDNRLVCRIAATGSEVLLAASRGGDIALCGSLLDGRNTFLRRDSAGNWSGTLQRRAQSACTVSLAFRKQQQR